MPDVVYRTEATARKKLEAKGLVVEVKYVENEKVSEGTVISQSIESGTEVISGTPVTLAVSRKGDKAKVPDVQNMKLEDAKSLLIVNGLLYNIKYEKSSTVDKDVVISQSVKPGIEVKHGTEVQIVVSCADEEIPETE